MSGCGLFLFAGLLLILILSVQRMMHEIGCVFIGACLCLVPLALGGLGLWTGRAILQIAGAILAAIPFALMLIGVLVTAIQTAREQRRHRKAFAAGLDAIRGTRDRVVCGGALQVEWERDDLYRVETHFEQTVMSREQLLKKWGRRVEGAVVRPADTAAKPAGEAAAGDRCVP